MASRITRALAYLLLAPALRAAEPALVKLAVSEGTDIRFSHLVHQDGFPPGQIGDILQDDQGFLWFNTSGFLNRYDGYTFKPYTRDAAHPNYPAAGPISTIFKDRSGNLWVSTYGELDLFDPVTETSTRFPIDRDGPRSLSGPVSHISQDHAGTLWLATQNGLYRLDAPNGTFRHYSHDPSNPASVSNSEVRSTYEDREGTLWVCTPAGVDAFDPRSERVTERIPWPPSTKVLEDHAGVLWIISSRGNGLASWDRHARRLTLYSFKDRELPSSELSGAERIYEDADSNLWLTTYGSGLVKIDPARHSAVLYRFSKRPNSIDMNSVTALFEDREGTVWVGVAGGGVDKFRRKPLPFHRWVVEPGAPLEPFITLSTSVFVDTQENVWIGSPIGLLRIDSKTGANTLFNHSGPPPANLSNVFVISMVEDSSGYLWIGTYGGGLNRYDPRTRRFTAFRHNPADPSSLSHDNVFSLIVDRQGVLWAGTEDGLNRCDDPVNGRFHSWKTGPPGAPAQQVSAIAEDSNGALWLASRMLQRFDPATGRFTAYRLDTQTGKVARESSSTLVPSGMSTVGGSLVVAHSGVIWVATGNGLLSFDPRRELFTNYDERDGLPLRSINSLLEDHNGNLWIATAGGLSRFNPAAKTFTNYYQTDGLASEVFDNFPAAYQTRRGQMFFGNTRGLTSFWPDQIVENPAPPPVVLTSFSLLNTPVEPAPGSLLPESIAFTRSLTLSHKQNNTFSFEFAALSFLDPPRNQYRYRLEGLSPNWIPMDAAHRIATFSTLPARNYTLRIQGSNNRGVWNDQGVALQLKILPPWYQTWWFLTLCVAVFIALLAAAYRYRVWQIQQESRHLREVIETIPAYVWSAAPDGSVDFINRRWLDFTGFSLDQALGWGWANAIHPDDRKRLLEAWRAAIASGEALEIDARMRGADGRYRWLLFRSVPLRDESGKIVKWYGKSMDIEDRKQAEGERERMHQLESDLAHINRVSMMGELAASIAHEVNQPLTGIVSNGGACLRLLAGDKPNLEEAREAIGDIVRDGKRAGEVIARIRALTKRATVSSEMLDLNQTIRDVLVLVADQAKKHAVTIRTQFASDLPSVAGDRVQLQQVVLNLVMNAIEAMAVIPDRPRELVIATQTVEHDQVEATVQDSGVGIAPEKMARIFDSFYTTKSSGMGMGLSISRSILQNHGGALWATANDGPGTTFHFTLRSYRTEEQPPAREEIAGGVGSRTA